MLGLVQRFLLKWDVMTGKRFYLSSPLDVWNYVKLKLGVCLSCGAGEEATLSPAKLSSNDGSKLLASSPSVSPSRGWIPSPSHDPQWYPSDSSDSTLGCLLCKCFSPLQNQPQTDITIDNYLLTNLHVTNRSSTSLFDSIQWVKAHLRDTMVSNNVTVTAHILPRVIDVAIVWNVPPVHVHPASMVSPDKGRRTTLTPSGPSSGTALLGPSLLDCNSQYSFQSRGLPDVAEVSSGLWL